MVVLWRQNIRVPLTFGYETLKYFLYWKSTTNDPSPNTFQPSAVESVIYLIQYNTNTYRYLQPVLRNWVKSPSKWEAAVTSPIQTTSFKKNYWRIFFEVWRGNIRWLKNKVALWCFHFILGLKLMIDTQPYLNNFWFTFFILVLATYSRFS